MRWWRLPRPGTVGIDYLAGEFYQDKTPSCLAPGYVGYLPKRYPQTQAWPLVVFLHGSGGRGNAPETLLDWGRFLSSQGFLEASAIVLLPQCRKQASWQPRDVAEFVEHACHHYRVDRDRIYLVGYSMGGFGTWAAAAAQPDLFAAMVPIAGGGNTEDATRLANIPIWAFHGAADKTVPARQTTKVIDAIREVGGAPKLTVFPEAGHGISRQVCEMPELWQWLFQQNRTHTKRPSKAATGEEKGN